MHIMLPHYASLLQQNCRLSAYCGERYYTKQACQDATLWGQMCVKMFAKPQYKYSNKSALQ